VIGLKQIAGLGGGSVEEFNEVYAFAFPRPGRYFVKLQFSQVESNVVAIDVVQPTGIDADANAELQDIEESRASSSPLTLISGRRTASSGP